MDEVVANIFAILAGTGTTATLLVWLAGKWIGSRIDSSIKHEYDKRKAEYESELRKRERAQLVAELLAEWMSTVPDEPMSSDQRKKLNKLSFEATLWLPDGVAAELSRVLQHDPRAPNMFNLLLRVREHLNGPHNLTVENVTQWQREKEIPNLGLPPGCKNGQLHVHKIIERTNGSSHVLTEQELGAGYGIPAGCSIDLFIAKGNLTAEVSTSEIQHLRLVGKIETPENLQTLIVETFPKSCANDINRSVHGEVASKLFRPSTVSQ